MGRQSKLVLLLSVSVLATWASADDLSRKRLEADIRFLADDQLEGRGTPSRGLELAALYLANELRAAGWEPANEGSFLQEYALEEYSPAETRTVVKANGVTLRPDEYLLLLSAADPAAVSRRYEAVFAGDGIVSPERGRDAYADLDVHGKAVITILGAPWKVDPETLFECDHLLGKDLQAGVRNAGMLVYVSEELESPPDKPASQEAGMVRFLASTPVVRLSPGPAQRPAGFSPAVLILTPPVFDRVLAPSCGGTYAEWKTRLVDGGSARARPVSATVELSVEAQPKKGRSANVVAALRGRDPALRDEWVVLSGHYDHMGRVDVPSGQDGIFNGADDNASGVAAALEIARKLRGGPPPRRSVLVLLTSGEERGLLGAAHYSFHPLVPPKRVVANVNLDMVGRSDGSVSALAAGSDDLFRAAKDLGAPAGIKIEPDANPTWRLIYFVDSYHFARLGVPAIELITGMHKDYHQPSDTADLIRYDQLTRLTDAVYRLVNHYAQGAPKPAFQRPEWFLLPD